MKKNDFYIETFPVGPLQCNCTILADRKTGRGIIIDHGDEPEKIIEKVQAQGIKVEALLHTHAHFDHIFGTAQVHQALSAKIFLHRDDLFLYNHLSSQAAIIGFVVPEYRAKKVSPEPVDSYLQDKDPLDFVTWGGTVIHTPGHTPGSLSFYFPELQLLFSGDTLFYESIGRTDLPGGDFKQIIASLREKLLILPETTEVIPGHGPKTNLAHEKRHNPFVLEYASF